MRMLLPRPSDPVDLREAYAVPPGQAGRHLRVNMVSSLDGAAAVSGRVGTLTGPADQVLLHLLRGLCDVLLVGAGTVRAEGYGPLTVPDELRQRRLDEGRQPEPRLAVLTRSLALDLAAPVFTEATQRPLVVTAAHAPAERLARAREVADVIVAGEQQVDLTVAVDALADAGLPRVLSEGGPHVLAGLLAADLVDELCLAVAPALVCGDELRLTAGPALTPPRQLALAHVLEQDDFLFLRYGRSPAVDAGA